MATFEHLHAQTDQRVVRYIRWYRNVKATVRSAAFLLGAGFGALPFFQWDANLGARITTAALIAISFIICGEAIAHGLQDELDDWEDENHQRIAKTGTAE